MLCEAPVGNVASVIIWLHLNIICLTTYSFGELIGESAVMAIADVSPVIGCWKLVRRFT